MNVWRMKLFNIELIIIQQNPDKKYCIVISLFSSRTFTASLADLMPSLPRRNLPGPNTEQVAEFKIAHNSNPIAHAVIERYAI